MLSKNNQYVIDVLREKQLHYLINPFKQMIEFDRLDKIKVHKMTWKAILNQVYTGDRSSIENEIIAYLVAFGILVVKKKKVDKRKSKDRVKKHREHKKELGYTQMTVLISKADLERLKRFKSKRVMTYEELFSYMINNLPSRA